MTASCPPGTEYSGHINDRRLHRWRGASGVVLYAPAAELRQGIVMFSSPPQLQSSLVKRFVYVTAGHGAHMQTVPDLECQYAQEGYLQGRHMHSGVLSTDMRETIQRILARSRRIQATGRSLPVGEGSAVNSVDGERRFAPNFHHHSCEVPS
nr:hypothetical protein CFP56_66170 [Quercus suber]